jgi:lysylphosphatidylglycerol synthetase-like protein (DUF2156 family)
MDCREAQQIIDRRVIDPAVETHLGSCAQCAMERRVATALRSTVLVETPPELSTHLLALAAPAPRPARLDIALQNALVISAPPELSRRLEMLVPGVAPAPVARRPWLMALYAVTALLAGVLLFFAAQAFSLALQQLGVVELWQSAAQLPGQWLQQLYTFFPQGHYVVDAFLSLQRALQWVLAGLLMWAVLEMRTPRRARSVA